MTRRMDHKREGVKCFLVAIEEALHLEKVNNYGSNMMSNKMFSCVLIQANDVSLLCGTRKKN